MSRRGLATAGHCLSTAKIQQYALSISQSRHKQFHVNQFDLDLDISSLDENDLSYMNFQDLLLDCPEIRQSLTKDILLNISHIKIKESALDQLLKSTTLM